MMTKLLVHSYCIGVGRVGHADKGKELRVEVKQLLAEAEACRAAGY